ncbi:ATP-binding protein [Paracoccus sp. (in: a-proteobacteria)]|uniref:ATP-binding protein n=1 Tax=Paracoccus sp. TaxID=267 RepID=UPI0026DEF6E8|nr:ATP-binding protein [Paracoccus sp. (in: a-proteobacteria)]MDO5369078.1 ATP-binding protein [Paracoccus sp. (in: a-proteobacteria)]
MVSSWLKHLLPRGLYGRAALILFLPVVVITLVVTVMFLQRHFEDVTQQMVETAAAEVALVTDRVLSAPDGPQALIAGQEIAVPLGLTLELPPSRTVEERRRFYDFSGRVVIADMHRRLPAVEAVDLWDLRRVRVLVGGPRPFLLELPRRRLTPSNPHQLLVLMVATSLLMTAIASVFLRNQLRPIRRLADAADAYGRGQVKPYRPAGASEVRSAGRAFVEMRARIERQNEQRRMMLSGISHDLRTPLTRLRLGLSMLGPDLPPERDEIADMERDVAEMGTMIDAFLDHARTEAQDGGPETVAMREFMDGIVGDAQRGGQPVRLARFHSDSPDATAVIRPQALRRAIENLVGNAVRYGSRAELEAVLTSRSLRIAVEDDGPGIPPGRREEAVRPFVRLDAARNQDRGQGAGLGLAIAADIARAHGGELRLSDARLGGLRAEIVIPR